MAWEPDYIAVAQAAAYLRIDDNADDTELAGLVTTASREIDGLCNRQFGQVAAPVARTYRRTPVYDPTSGMWLLEIHDVQTSAGLLVNGVAYASSGATLLPDNAPADGRPWTRLGMVSWPFPSFPGAPQSNVITAQFGWSAVPVPVVEATKFQVARLAARRDSPMGIAGSPEQGSELRLLARLDVDIPKMLAKYRRRRRAG